MSYPTTGNAASALHELSQIAHRTRGERERAQLVLADILQHLIGTRVCRFGRVYEIAGARIGLDNTVDASGRTVSARGKVGTRQFSLGDLEECEFL